MKKICRIIILFTALVCYLNKTIAYFTTSTLLTSDFFTGEYVIQIDGNGGLFNNDNILVQNNQTTLPTPFRNGYQFLGFSDEQSGSVKYLNNIYVDEINHQTIYAKWQPYSYPISYQLNGGTLYNYPKSYNVEQVFTLPIPEKTGYNFIGWTGSNGIVPQKNVIVSKGTTGDLHYVANWEIKSFVLDINPIIQNKIYNTGLSGFTFSVWIDDVQVADHQIDYYNASINYNSKVRVCVYDRDGYNVTSFRDKTWTVSSDLIINPTWYDNIPPTITSFSVINQGFYDPSVGSKKGWNIKVYINGYDTGTGIQKYQTWLAPYKNGSGASRVDGQERILKNVLYLNTAEGRTFCAYAIDNAGNESSRCETIKVK